MLVLTRKVDEAICISGGIRVRVLGIDGRDRVKLGIDAPAEVSVLREELVTAAPLSPRAQERAELEAKYAGIPAPDVADVYDAGANPCAHCAAELEAANPLDAKAAEVAELIGATLEILPPSASSDVSHAFRRNGITVRVSPRAFIELAPDRLAVLVRREFEAAEEAR